MQPVQKISKTRKRKRRSHHALKPIHYVRCPQCSTAVPSHVICPKCGYYQGRTVVQVDEG